MEEASQPLLKEPLYSGYAPFRELFDVEKRKQQIAEKERLSKRRERSRAKKAERRLEAQRASRKKAEKAERRLEAQRASRKKAEKEKVYLLKESSLLTKLEFCSSDRGLRLRCRAGEGWTIYWLSSEDSREYLIGSYAGIFSAKKALEGIERRRQRYQGPSRQPPLRQSFPRKHRAKTKHLSLRVEK
jgi:flagellar biosynthesis GTPase FlhF